MSENKCRVESLNSSADQRYPCPVLHSPLPYLLAGLITMVVLVTIALTIVAWPRLKRFLTRPSSRQQRQQQQQQQQQAIASSECSEIKSARLSSTAAQSYERLVVIMAGQSKPSHLATASKLTEALV